MDCWLPSQYKLEGAKKERGNYMVSEKENKVHEALWGLRWSCDLVWEKSVVKQRGSRWWAGLGKEQCCSLPRIPLLCHPPLHQHGTEKQQ